MFHVEGILAIGILHQAFLFVFCINQYRSSPGRFLVYLHHFLHAAPWYCKAATALCSQRNILLLTGEPCHLACRMNQDTTGFCQIITLVETTKANAVFELHSPLSYHDISSKTRTTSSRGIAELWLGSRIAFTASMHAIAAHHPFATLQVIYKESLLARWFGEIHQDVVIRTVSPSVAIISYLRQVLTIHLKIPLFSIHRILEKRFCKPIINRWNEKDTDNKQNQYSQYNQ